MGIELQPDETQKGSPKSIKPEVIKSAENGFYKAFPMLLKEGLYLSSQTRYLKSDCSSRELKKRPVFYDIDKAL